MEAQGKVGVLGPAATKEKRAFGWRDKVGYLCGDLGNDLFFGFIMYYLMVYFTDSLYINPAAVGVLFLVARLWDAFADVTWGAFYRYKKDREKW